MLTNFTTVSRSIKRLQLLERMEQDGSMALRSKKEVSRLMKEKDKLDKNLGGIKNMKGVPAAMYVVDPHSEKIAVQEANRLGIPVIAITDTNCDPDPIQWVIPANDDAIRSVQLITSRIAESIWEGRLEFDNKLAEGLAVASEGADAGISSELELTKEEFVEKEFVASEITSAIPEEEPKDILDIDEMLKTTNLDDLEEDFKK